MNRILTLLLCLSGAWAFAQYVPIEHIFSGLQPLIVTLSIIVAAVFVRLNRGMPTLEWKSLEPNKRAKLTTKIVEITYEYAAIVASSAVACLFLLALAIAGQDEIKIWSRSSSKLIVGLVGFTICISIIRMIYVVWRDIDVVKLQKELIDTAASDQQYKENNEIADKKIERMKESAVQGPKVNPPTPWEK
ncbi:hypothetical protein [Sediminicoccus rosea]|uniref:Uncharacterized protein n=1 Tax=Sediminicoccus rosea TaxID=1225128 RepID=A0ABZ0PKV9_9PROT|nr:hypothetical protein [Sediminicoccus rosea]WPB86210.1 hypothetical protein R9Z33_04905 [Sediminicoccus rosea]